MGIRHFHTRYNGDGLKVRRTGPDATRLYYYDGIRPIYETDATGALLMRYDRDLFGNLLSSRDPAGGRRYYHYDGLGSTTALTDAMGAVAATMLYDAWGNQRAATGSGHGRYRFTGAERDDATGLVGNAPLTLGSLRYYSRHAERPAGASQGDEPGRSLVWYVTSLDLDAESSPHHITIPRHTSQQAGRLSGILTPRV